MKEGLYETKAPYHHHRLGITDHLSPPHQAYALCSFLREGNGPAGSERCLAGSGAPWWLLLQSDLLSPSSAGNEDKIIRHTEVYVELKINIIFELHTQSCNS